MAVVDFTGSNLTGDDQLTLTDDAIAYAQSLTGNILADTSRDSAFRFLVEAQVYTYTQIQRLLTSSDEEIEAALYKILSYKLSTATYAKATLKFELYQTFTRAVFIPGGFPVQSLTGILFVTDSIITIPAGSLIGYAIATSLTSGKLELAANTINLPRKALDFPIRVTNESAVSGGSSADTLVDAKVKLAKLISANRTINALDYSDRLAEYDPSLFCSIDTGVNNTLTIAIGRKDGIQISDSVLQSTKSFFDSIKYIGVNNITVVRATIIRLFVELNLHVLDYSLFAYLVPRIGNEIYNYLLPSGVAQTRKAGIILLNQIERVIANYDFDYLQTIRIGTSETNAVGNNFTFNQFSERCILGTVKMNIIDPNSTHVETINY